MSELTSSQKQKRSKERCERRFEETTGSTGKGRELVIGKGHLHRFHMCEATNNKVFCLSKLKGMCHKASSRPILH